MDKKAPSPAAVVHFEKIKHLPVEVRMALREFYKIRIDIRARQSPHRQPKK